MSTLDERNKPAGHWLRGTKLLLDSLLDFAGTSTPYIDMSSDRSSIIIKDSDTLSFKIEELTSGDSILEVDTTNKVVKIGPTYTLNQGYTSYVANITQSGAAAPTVTVLENTLSGTPIWSYAGAGQYDLTLAGEFVANKVVAFATSGTNTTIIKFNYSDGAPNAVRLISGNENGDAEDDRLANATVEIRVYP